MTLLLPLRCLKTLNYLESKVQTALTFKFSTIWLPVTFPTCLPAFPKISLFQPTCSVYYSQRCRVCGPTISVIAIFFPLSPVYLRFNCALRPAWCPGFSSEVPNDLLFIPNFFYSLYCSFSTYIYIVKSFKYIYIYYLCEFPHLLLSIFSKF